MLISWGGNVGAPGLQVSSVSFGLPLHCSLLISKHHLVVILLLVLHISGCFSKDQVYLDGILRILRHRQTIDFHLLAALGKVSSLLIILLLPCLLSVQGLLPPSFAWTWAVVISGNRQPGQGDRIGWGSAYVLSLHPNFSSPDPSQKFFLSKSSSLALN